MKKGALVLNITLQRKHFYSLLALFVIVLGAVLVNAFGGNNPAILGHSAEEIIVNDSSIPGQLSGSKINVATLSGSAPSLSVGSASSASTAGFVTSSPGCGGNNFYNPDPGSCVSLLNSNNAITYNAPTAHTFTGGPVNIQGAAGLNVQGAGGILTSSTQRLDSSGNLVNIGTISASGTITTTSGSISATSGTISTGGNIVRRSTGCPSFNYLTTDAAAGGCGGVVDTGLRVS